MGTNREHYAPPRPTKGRAFRGAADLPVFVVRGRIEIAVLRRQLQESVVRAANHPNAWGERVHNLERLRRKPEHVGKLAAQMLDTLRRGDIKHDQQRHRVLVDKFRELGVRILKPLPNLLDLAGRSVVFVIAQIAQTTRGEVVEQDHRAISTFGVRRLTVETLLEVLFELLLEVGRLII